MHLFKTLTTAATAFLAVASAVAIPAVDVSGAPAIDEQPPLTSGEAETILEKRADALFTIGYALCSWTIISGSHPVGGSREDMFFWPGQYDVGCVEHDKSNIWTYVANSRTSFFKAKVCNVDVDFYLTNGNYDFYRAGGNGVLVGTCYPYSGARRFCLEAFGSCAVRASWRCYYSGRANAQRVC